MKRLCIFSIYDKAGIVDKSVEFYLNSMCEVVNKLIVVVNGSITENSLQCLKKYTENIYIRKNVGFDAAAYKDCILNYMGMSAIREYDELVLANDTCFGPFVPFINVFKEMEDYNCDFWGLKKIENSFATHIQSYFLVFRKKILYSEAFFEFWQNNIDETSTDIKDVYPSFETGLYRKLISNGYIPGVYGNNGKNINNYSSSYYCLKAGEILLKKKVFDNKLIDESNVGASLQFIINEYNYDFEIIKELAKRKYNKQIDINNILNTKYMPKCDYYEQPSVEEEELIHEISRYKNIYIYGAGIWAYHVLYFLKEKDIKVNGFFVSDMRIGNPKKIHNIEVKEWNESLIDGEDGVIVAMNKANSKEIYEINYQNERFIWLWKDLSI